MGLFGNLFKPKTHRTIKHYNNGDWYEGEVDEKGFREGYGIYHYIEGVHSDAEFYEGEWRHDLKEGRGIYRWESGNEYDGEWENDCRNGTGTLYYKNGGRYEGGWLNDKRHGYGVYTYTSGQWYEAEWDHGNAYWAVYHWPNGDKCEGRMSNPGKMDGICTYTKADGTSRRCRYENGTFITYL